MAVPQTLHLIPTPVDATSPTLRHFQELKSAPPRASGFTYACSATKALAGDGPIAVPHTAAQDEDQARCADLL